MTTAVFVATAAAALAAAVWMVAARTPATAARALRVCLIAAADTRAKRGLRELMAEFYNGYDQFAPDYEDPRSAVDCTKMRTLFGWTPSFSWRDHD